MREKADSVFCEQADSLFYSLEKMVAMRGDEDYPVDIVDAILFYVWRVMTFQHGFILNPENTCAW